MAWIFVVVLVTGLSPSFIPSAANVYGAILPPLFTLITLLIIGAVYHHKKFNQTWIIVQQTGQKYQIGNN